MKQAILILGLAVVFFSNAHAQPGNARDAKLVGGACEGCEAVFEYGTRTLASIDTLPDFDDIGVQIKVTGTVYQNDGSAPADGVILYVYHTDQKGIYAVKGNETGWGRRHGYIRGWVKTDKNGKYAFYTLKPGIYPNRSSPAHIHLTILEPNGKYYWLESYHFEGDPLLTEKEKSPQAPRGGSSGMLSLRKVEGILVGERDIILGRNVPGYK